MSPQEIRAFAAGRPRDQELCDDIEKLCPLLLASVCGGTIAVAARYWCAPVVMLDPE